MQSLAILTVTCDDKPGIVEAISTQVSHHYGNWLESRLALLAGKFVGVVRISLPQAQCEPLTQALTTLKEIGIHVELSLEDSLTETMPILSAHFHAVGPDRAGIIRELSTSFAKRGINVIELETQLSSMAYSGEPLFEASGEITLPNTIELQEVYQKLDDIANDLGIDISIEMIE